VSQFEKFVIPAHAGTLVHQLVKIPALAGCDQEVRKRTLAAPHKVREGVSKKETRNHFEPRDVRVSLPRRADE